MPPPVYAFLHHPGDFSSRSGMYPLAEALAARSVFYAPAWQRVQARSWRLGQALRRWGIAYYGSTWNSLVPVLGELRLSRALPSGSGAVAHFLWAEFASPRHPVWFRRRGGAVVGTFHASARRQPDVLRPRFRYDVFDGITLMSKSQAPYLLERGVAASRMRVILHGVDVEHFTPPPAPPAGDGPLRAMLIGSTERDHAFLAGVLRRMPAGAIEVSVCTPREQQVHYAGVPNCRVLPYQSNEDLLALYRSSELLVMPMLDCTANNAILEAMACGTPVMANRVGGIPEYVDGSCSVVMDDKRVDEWVDALRDLARDRARLLAWRPAVRRWAERFAWPDVARQYREFYEKLASADDDTTQRD